MKKKINRIGGAAVSGRQRLAGTEARPTKFIFI